MSELKIVVSGPTGTGKSHVLAVIERALKEEYGDAIEVVCNDTASERNSLGEDIRNWKSPTVDKIVLLEAVERSIPVTKPTSKNLKVSISRYPTEVTLEEMADLNHLLMYVEGINISPAATPTEQDGLGLIYTRDLKELRLRVEKLKSRKFDIIVYQDQPNLIPSIEPKQTVTHFRDVSINDWFILDTGDIEYLSLILMGKITKTYSGWTKTPELILNKGQFAGLTMNIDPSLRK